MINVRGAEVADFLLKLKSDWTEAKQVERALRAVESLTPLDSLSIEDIGEDRSEAEARLANALKWIQETFGERVKVSVVGKTKAKIHLVSVGCCGVCGGEGRK